MMSLCSVKFKYTKKCTVFACKAGSPNNICVINIVMTEKKEKKELDLEDDPTRIIIPRDYATSVHITKFDETVYPKRVEEKKVR